MTEKIEGLIAAPFAPMTSSGDINPGLIPAYAATLRKNNVRGVFVNGTTGEGMSLTISERKILAGEWVRYGGGLLVIVHVGHESWREAATLTKHAQEAGADGVGLSAPCFYKPGLSELVEFCAAVAAHAPGLPFYYYHMPAMSGVNIAMYDFVRAAAPKISSLAGIKFTHENIMDYQRCLEYDDGRFDILFGRDEILLAALAVGARGAIGSTFNYAAPLYNHLIAAFHNGDLKKARKYQAKAQSLVHILQESGNGIACGKAMMPMLTDIDCGPCRLPLPVFTSEKQQWLRKRVEEWQQEN